MESNNYLFQELTEEMALIYGSYATTTSGSYNNNQFQPARQEYAQEVDAGPSAIRDIDLDFDPSAIPRTPQHIYCGIDLRYTLQNSESLDASSRQQQRQNSDRGSPASSDGQFHVSTNYELYNANSIDTSTSTSTNRYNGSISDYASTPSGSLPSTSLNRQAETTTTVGSFRPPVIRQHFWIQRAQITPTKALNCHVSEAFKNGAVTYFCAWPGCTHPIGFAQKAQVITHVRSAHLQEKPYFCTTCNTAFARKQDANRHVVSLNRGKQYRCSVCHRAYSRRHYRNEHEERCLLEALSGSPDFEPRV